MDPTELVIFDWDDTLYVGRKALLPDEGFYCRAESLKPWAPPGFDSRWNLDVVVRMRRALINPRACVVVLSGRPDCTEIHAHIGKMLQEAGVTPHLLQLKPMGYPSDDAVFKSVAIEKWLELLPTVASVVAYEDQQSNLDSLRGVAERRGLSFTGHKV